MDPKDKEKTAYTTPLRLNEFERMPFGLCNAPATFQRLMQWCLSVRQLSEFLLVYLDDIIIYSPDFSSHLKHLEEVAALPKAALGQVQSGSARGEVSWPCGR